MQISCWILHRWRCEPTHFTCWMGGLTMLFIFSVGPMFGASWQQHLILSYCQIWSAFSKLTRFVWVNKITERLSVDNSISQSLACGVASYWFFFNFFKTVSTPFPGIEDVKNFISPVSLFPDICKLGLTCFFVEKVDSRDFCWKNILFSNLSFVMFQVLSSFPSPKS